MIVDVVVRVKALAEIFNFAAGLVQRVPKKPNEVKADLQNSTARLWNQKVPLQGLHKNAVGSTASPD